MKIIIEKEIPGYDGDYTITDTGKVISYKTNTPKILSTWFQKSGYENIKLSKNNQTYHHLIHRLVAEAFIPNPNNFPQVNHKDKNRSNNNVDNLEWSSIRDNIHDSYDTMSPIRNYKNCILKCEDTDEIIGAFSSIIEAARYANKHFGCSVSGMQRNYVSKGYKIECKKCND